MGFKMFCGFQGSMEWLVDWLSATVQLQATGFSDQVTPLYRQAALQAETGQKTGELFHFFPPPALLLNFRLTLGRGRFCLPGLSARILYSQLSAILKWSDSETAILEWSDSETVYILRSRSACFAYGFVCFPLKLFWCLIFWTQLVTVLHDRHWTPETWVLRCIIFICQLFVAEMKQRDLSAIFKSE